MPGRVVANLPGALCKPARSSAAPLVAKVSDPLPADCVRANRAVCHHYGVSAAACCGSGPNLLTSIAIARHKAKDMPRIRRLEDSPLRAVAGSASEDELALAQLKAVAHPPRRWGKSPDSPLGEVIEHKHARRAVIAAKGGRRKARGQHVVPDPTAYGGG